MILIHNAGPVECEVDVSDSPNRDPLMEPSVWLDPGGNGRARHRHRRFAVRAAGAGRPSVDLVVNGEAVEVPVALPETCGVTLTAIYTAD